MSEAFLRRVDRAHAATSAVAARSKRIIWCFELEKMPTMIDLLIAQDRLDDADRPHCVHWTTIRRGRELSAEDAGKMVDAGEMLEAAGIDTLTAQARNALLQGIPAFEAFMQEHFGGLDTDERAEFEKLGREMRSHAAQPP